MTTYFTSDTHFGHGGMLSDRMPRPRPFASIEAMDEAMVGFWNKPDRPQRSRLSPRRLRLRVLAGARPVHLRPAQRREDPHPGQPRRARRAPALGGRDPRRHAISVQDRGMAEPVDLWMSHYCHATWPDLHRGRIHIYGHSHGSIAPTARACDVGVDVWQFRPVTIPEIQELLADVAAGRPGPPPPSSWPRRPDMRGSYPFSEPPAGSVCCMTCGRVSIGDDPCRGTGRRRAQ